MTATTPNTPHRKRASIFLLAIACCAMLAAGRPASGGESGDAQTSHGLRALVAPVARCPDVVLASLLPATTEPADLAAAAAHLESRKGRVERVPSDTAWDPSVAAMLQFPEVLRWLRDNKGWTARLGAAVAARPQDLLRAIQDVRARECKAGTLRSDKRIRVVVSSIQDSTVIEVVPARGTAPRRAWARHFIRWGGGLWGARTIEFHAAPHHVANHMDRFTRPRRGTTWKAARVATSEERGACLRIAAPRWSTFSAVWYPAMRASEASSPDALVPATVDPATDGLPAKGTASSRAPVGGYGHFGVLDPNKTPASHLGIRIPRVDRTQGYGGKTRPRFVRTVGSAERSSRSPGAAARGGRTTRSGGRTPRSTSVWEQQRERIRIVAAHNELSGSDRR